MRLKLEWRTIINNTCGWQKNATINLKNANLVSFDRNQLSLIEFWWYPVTYVKYPYSINFTLKSDSMNKVIFKALFLLKALE